MGGGLDGNGYYSGRLDIFNNVVYNWGGRTTDGGAHEINFVGNYYKEGPACGNHCIFTLQLEGTGQGTQSAYFKNNIRDNQNGTIDIDKDNMKSVQISSSQVVDWNYWGTEPYFPSYAKIDEPVLAYKKVLSDAGATMPVRDDQHQRMVREALNRTYTYVGSRSGIRGEIDHEDDAGGFEAFPEETRAEDFDTDQDGMPNWFERLIGSDENVANHNDDPDRDGWTLLEDYLDFMAHPYVIVAPGESAEVNVAPYFRGFTNSPTYTIAYESNGLFEAAIADSTLAVAAKWKGGVTNLMMKVTDAEGDSFEQRLNIAVTGDPSAIPHVFDERQINVAKREFFTVDGRPVEKFQSQETYVMRLTDVDGKIYTMKVIKN
jgi:hypothetical protein